MKKSLLAFTMLSVLWSCEGRTHEAELPFADSRESEWIGQGNYKNPKTGEHCCGDYDCKKIKPENVKDVPGGFEVTLPDGTKEFVPMQEAHTSEDGQWWRCHRFNGSRRCFFMPGRGS